MGTSGERRKKLDHDELARRLAAACLLEGEFLLRSGATSDRYFDKYRFEADPVLLAGVARLLAPMVPEEVEVLAGLELGGVPVATALSFATGLPAAFVRKEAKTYGTARLAEGSDIVGKHVLVVEDVVSSGGQIVLSTSDLRDRGAIVDHAICVVDRGGADALAAAGIKLHALFTLAELVPPSPPLDASVPARPTGSIHGDVPAPAPPTGPSSDHIPAPAPPGDPARPPGGATESAPPVAEPEATPTTTSPRPGGAAPSRTGTPLLPTRQSQAPRDRKVAPPLLPRRANDPPT